MITGIKLHKYKKDPFTGFESLDTSYDMLDYLPLEEYELDYELEFNEVWEFIASSMDLEFDNNLTFLEEFTKANLSKYFYGIEVFVDGVSEFWGYVDPLSIELDEERDMWSLTINDFITYYWSIWENRATTNIRGIKNTEPTRVPVDSIVKEMIKGSLLKGVRFLVDSADTRFSRDFFNDHLRKDGSFTQTQFIREIQKHYGAFVFVDNNGYLVFVNRTFPMADRGIDISEGKISSVRKVFDNKQYNGVIFTHWFIYDERTNPRLNWLTKDYAENGLYVMGAGEDGKINIQVGLPYGASSSDIKTEMEKQWGELLDLSECWNSYGIGGDFMPQNYMPNGFIPTGIQDRFNQYAGIVKVQDSISVEVDGYDYSLLERVKYNDKYYMIHKVRKRLLNETSELKLKEEV